MPAESERQRRAAGMALSAKQGKIPVSKLKGAAREMYNSMTIKQLREFAHSVRKITHKLNSNTDFRGIKAEVW